MYVLQLHYVDVILEERKYQYRSNIVFCASMFITKYFIVHLSILLLHRGMFLFSAMYLIVH